jgi:hypothetical protein
MMEMTMLIAALAVVVVLFVGWVATVMYNGLGAHWR